MKRDALGDEIDLLDHFVAEGEARRIVQAQLVSYLSADGQSTRAAQRLLQDLDEVLAAMRRTRARLHLPPRMP